LRRIESRQLLEIPIGDLAPTPDQPRQRFDEGELGELAASIAQHGVLQPLLVTKTREGSAERYRIVAGERRWRAATIARIPVVPALLIGDDQEVNREIALIENIHRTNLQPLELAHALDAILRSTGITQDELAKRLGKSRVSITNNLRLLGLGYAAQQALASERISEGHARALLAVTGPTQDAALRQVTLLQLSVRQTEALVRRLGAKRAAAREPVSDGLDALSDALRTVLQAPVTVSGSSDTGRISIEYHSREELERICERIGGAELADELA
jgi:ParB family transcriptional regulator, chromosome partitioning protein